MTYVANAWRILVFMLLLTKKGVPSFLSLLMSLAIDGVWKLQVLPLTTQGVNAWIILVFLLLLAEKLVPSFLVFLLPVVVIDGVWRLQVLPWAT